MKITARIIKIGLLHYWLFSDGRILPVIQGGALPASDAFTGSNGTALTTYSASWTLNYGNFQINTNALAVNGGDGTTDAAAHWNADSFGNDQYSEITVAAIAVNTYIGLCVRAAASAATFYNIVFNDRAAYLSKYVDGSGTGLASSTADQNHTAGDVDRLEIVGTTLTPTKNGGAWPNITGQTDSSISSGSAGVSGNGTNTGSRMDDWEGGNIGGGGPTNITVAEGHQAQASDAATMGVKTPITPTEGKQAQASDPSVLGVKTPIAPAEGKQAQVSDASVIGVRTPITPAEGKQAQASDAASMGVISPIAPAEANQAQASDAASISSGAVFNITPAEAAQAQASDPAALGIFTPVATSEGHQAQASDAAGLTPIYLLTAGEAAQAQISDPAILSSGEISISPAEGRQAQASDAASISFTAAGETYNITVADGTQAQASDPAVLAAIYPIAPAQANQAQASDAAALTSYAPTYNITVADGTQAQMSDPATFGVITPVIAAEAHQAQTADLIVLILANMILHGERRLYKMHDRATADMHTRPIHQTGTRDDLEVDD